MSEPVSDCGMIRLMHYDPRWRQEFEQTRSGVLDSCQGWVTAVEHIGSTAISGLIARPEIDLLAGIDSDEALEPATLALEGLYYRAVPSPPWAAAAVTLEKPRHGVPTHRVFLMRRDSTSWLRAVRLRDWLRQHTEIALWFEQAKVHRWRSGQGDPEQYEADKRLFFAHLEDQIEARREEGS